MISQQDQSGGSYNRITQETTTTGSVMRELQLGQTGGNYNRINQEVTTTASNKRQPQQD